MLILNNANIVPVRNILVLVARYLVKYKFYPQILYMYKINYKLKQSTEQPHDEEKTPK